jgi:hypothetical protein
MAVEDTLDFLKLHNTIVDERDKLRAENQRMRTALENIKKDTFRAETTMEANAYYIAEEALAIGEKVGLL